MLLIYSDEAMLYWGKPWVKNAKDIFMSHLENIDEEINIRIYGDLRIFSDLGNRTSRP